MNKKPACLIVDPYISGSMLCNALIAEGIAPIGILVDNWSDTDWRAERIKDIPFAKLINCFSAAEINNLPNAVEEYEIKGMLYGREGKSIYTADIIAQRYFPQFANLGDSAPRANKYAMHEACRQQGLLIAKQLHLSSSHISTAQQASINNMLPVVVKPTYGSGSQGVIICENFFEVEAAVKSLFSESFTLGEVSELIVQQQLMGTEYFVDMASIKGQHTACAIFRYHKILVNNRFIYQWAELVDHRSEEARACIHYVTQALTAIGMCNGLTHTELFITSQGPALIEVNPRVSGAYGIMNKMAKLAYDTNQIEFFAQALSGVPKVYPCRENHSPNGYTLDLLLQNWTSRKIGKLNIEALQKFASYHGHVLLKNEGTEMGVPTSLEDAVAHVILWHTSEQQLHEDAQAILALEKAELLF